MHRPLDPTNLDHQFDRKEQAENYLKYRPSYPSVFFENMFKQAYEEAKAKSPDGKINAVDLACGSGQLTRKILPYFDKVIGVDFSEAQLSNASKAFPEEIASNKLKLMHFDSSKVDELLTLPEIAALNPQFVFMGEAFHWFDYDDFLTRFKRVSLDNNRMFVIISYHIFEPVAGPPLAKEAVDEFVNTVNPFFKCNRPSIQNEYKEYDFTAFFEEVKFDRITEIVDAPVQSLIGYLDTWSAYRNYVNHPSNEGKEDPLAKMMHRMGLKNVKEREFGKLEVPEGAVSQIQYNNRFFSYSMRPFKPKH